MTKNRLRIIRAIVGIAIFAVFYFSVGLDDILRLYEEMNKWWLIPIFLLPIPVQMMAVWNYSILLKALGRKVDNIFMFRALNLGQALGEVSFGRAGEFSIVALMKQKGVPYGEGLAITVLDKLITLAILATLGLVGLTVYFEFSIWLVIFYLIGGGALVYAIVSDKIRGPVRKYLLRKYATHFEGFSQTFIMLVTKRKLYVFYNFAVSVVKWIVSFAGMWMIFAAYDINPPFIDIVLITSLVRLVSLTPISLSGLGVREVTGAFMYHTVLGVSTALAANVVLTSAIKGYVVAIVFYLTNSSLLKLSGETDKKPQHTSDK